ncbi:hypothetical protein Salat_1890200 [Sesamum alatum]|uniref:RNase H type-1 domain-containing protein n=1 Tax=Sesamum alatum TaxID=300844 RepID=A0AAE1Y4L0_9LAMI|nr:hypothetical protein Salat_1890200 [Sesamum alatum]
MMELGVGTIARNSAGECLAWRKRVYRFSIDPMVAEVMALLEEVKHGLSYGWPRVIFEGDCQIVISRVIAGEEDFSHLGPIVADIRRLLAQFLDSRLQYVPRDYNTYVHQLARSAVADEDG